MNNNSTKLHWKALSCVLIWTLFAVNAFGNQGSDKRIELIHSDSLIYISEHSGKVVQYLGNVFFRKGLQELRCDLATHYPDKEVIILVGQVDYRDTSRSLKSDYFEYHAEPELELARGNVELMVDRKKIMANEIAYHVDEEYAVARGDVRVYDRENLVNLFCQKLTYDKASKQAFAEEKPKLVKLDSLENPQLIIEAKSLAFNDSTKKAVARDSVVITRKGWVARSMLAEYFRNQDRVVLTEAPEVIHQKNSIMTAERIELFFENDSLRQVHMRGKGVMLSNFLLAGEPAFDRLSGQKFWINMEDDTVRNILVKGQATSTYHLVEEGKVQGVNQVLGDELKIIFEDGAIKDVFMASAPELSRGSFYPPKSKVAQIK